MSQWPLPRYHGLGGSSWKGSSFSASNAQGALNFLRHHRDVWRALPAAVAACLWSAQMIYFFVWFTTRPALPNGSWPRIGPSYAAFPFISCIGALRKWIFRSVSISVATLLWTAFGTDYCVGRRSRIGRFWRVGKLSLSTISSVFLVAVAFESVNDHHKLHLTFTSIQIMGMGGTKVCDWNLNRCMKNATPGNRYLRRSREWKRVAATIALLFESDDSRTPAASIVTVVGIYACTAKEVNHEVTFTPECWTLVSLAAVAEWTLSWCWVVFLGTVAYDAYHLDFTVRLLLSQSNVSSTSNAFDFRFWRKEASIPIGSEKQYGVAATDTFEHLMEEYDALYPKIKSTNSLDTYGHRESGVVDKADELEAGLLQPTRPFSMVGGRGARP